MGTMAGQCKSSIALATEATVSQGSAGGKGSTFFIQHRSDTVKHFNDVHPFFTTSALI